jgi:hypothetical protein
MYGRVEVMPRGTERCTGDGIDDDEGGLLERSTWSQRQRGLDGAGVPVFVRPVNTENADSGRKTA